MKLKLFLRDRSEDMARAWSAEFAGYSDVDISCGNIFEISADAIISPANSFGFMDGGIDLVYSYHFGWDLQKRLQEKIRGSFYGELSVGMAIIIETYHDKIKYLISCPTMRVPEIVSDTVNAYLAFRAGLIEIIRFNEKQGAKIASLLCPGLGTKTGGIAPENCARQMKCAYDQIICGKMEFPEDLSVAIGRHYGLVGEWTLPQKVNTVKRLRLSKIHPVQHSQELNAAGPDCNMPQCNKILTA